MDGATFALASVLIVGVIFAYLVTSFIAWLKNLFVRPPDDAIIEIKYGDYRGLKEDLNRSHRSGCFLGLLAIALFIACLFFASI